MPKRPATCAVHGGDWLAATVITTTVKSNSETERDQHLGQNCRENVAGRCPTEASAHEVEVVESKVA